VNSRQALGVAGLLLALAVVCGAFGGHTFRSQLAPEGHELWDTALRYHFLQALGLLGVGLTLRGEVSGALRAAAALIVLGIVLFCGSLYARALGAPHAVVFATPFGGLAWIAGWLLYAFGVWRHRGKE